MSLLERLAAFGVKISWPLGSGYDKVKDDSTKRARIVSFALSQKGKPYRLGAEAKDGTAKEWDCSELVEIGYKEAGLTIPDGSHAQFNFCRTVSEPELGDLGFLWKYGEPGKIGHVEILSDSLHTIGAVGIVPNCVRVADREWLEKHTRFAGWRRHPDLG